MPSLKPWWWPRRRPREQALYAQFQAYDGPRANGAGRRLLAEALAGGLREGPTTADADGLLPGQAAVVLGGTGNHEDPEEDRSDGESDEEVLQAHDLDCIFAGSRYPSPEGGAD